MAEKRYAILIASSKYPDEPGLHELRCPENDVDAVNEILASPTFGGFETFVFKNEPSYKILPKINSVLFDTNSEDAVLIYFSGHGTLNRPGHLYLATTDTKISVLESTSIPALTINYYFDQSYSKKKFLILDCCKSGAVGKMFKGGGAEEELRRMSEVEGTFIMTASTADQIAVEREEDQLSLFTKHLVAGIQSGEADKKEDGVVDMHELYSYVCEKVREEGAQKPMKWHLHASGDLIISRSGRNSKEKRMQEAKKKLYALAAQDLLTDNVVSEAVKVISIPKGEMTARDQECSLLVEQLAGEKIKPAVFMEQWWKTCFTHVGKTNAPEPEKEQRVVVLSEPTRIITPEPKQGDIIKDGITGMELVYIPAGCFMMGSSKDDNYHQDKEGPVHEVCLDAFWMGKYTVTQAQWQKIMGKNPSHFQKGDMYPVEQVSWDDVQKFLATLNKQSGKVYRLPTEAEWEYACRAGGSGKYDLDAVAWYDENSGSSTHPVGEKQANAFGLYDMLGNVWEWCGDWYDSSYYASSPKNNPQGTDKGGNRVLRGGSCFNYSLYCRAVFRSFSSPEDRNDGIGFRLVLPFQ